ncbi:hypothetical protein CEXT_361051 [Caerostris extrusa]|uniref:Uncharacterized protein n=1 Tax=Caerostris extrusa TaxID=172846 RepID=A0AAV4PJW6_CAEEX|nr:hypothetical protein CEXT_361051 [Caerostris extrusa]
MSTNMSDHPGTPENLTTSPLGTCEIFSHSTRTEKKLLEWTPPKDVNLSPPICCSCLFHKREKQYDGIPSADEIHHKGILSFGLGIVRHTEASFSANIPTNARKFLQMQSSG